MFDVGSIRAKTCAGESRRSFLKLGASVPIGLGLGIGAEDIAQAAEAVRAKTVLFVFLWGAPSHLDTCDPKPNAPAEYRGPFNVIPTRTPGVQFTELLPRMAKRTDKFTLVRTHNTTAPGHPDGGTVALTGYEEKPKPVKPNFGSIIAKHRGQVGKLPSFISIASGPLMDGVRIIEGYGGGTLGKTYDPFMLGASESGRVRIPGLNLLPDITPNRIQDRRKLNAQLDRIPRSLIGAGFEHWDRSYQTAYDLLMSPKARQAFDLTREPKKIREKYGQSVFGQSALLARRLVEAGIPYIQLNYSRHVEAITPGFEFGWDTHMYNFELLQDLHCPILDRVFPTLLDDLEDRGALDHTLVVCMGEFGRTPKINKRASRDHWPPCYYSIWAGAGLEPGRVIGASDKLGARPLNRPFSPLMVGTTIAELAGISSEARASMRVLEGGKVIDELL